MLRRFAFLLVLGAAVTTPAAAQGQYEPTAANLAARTWFQDAKFGLFIHWGIYSLLQDGEWVMQNRGIRVAEYETLAPEFDPVRFDAAESAAILAGDGSAAGDPATAARLAACGLDYEPGPMARNLRAVMATG